MTEWTELKDLQAVAKAQADGWKIVEPCGYNEDADWDGSYTPGVTYCGRPKVARKVVNDRELLELAAKTAGITGHLLGKNFVCRIEHELVKQDFLWNPLTDDGDALRLAVKLGLWMHIGSRDVSIESTNIEESATTGYSIQEATRRAIVRAAAEIGKGMRPFPSAVEIDQIADMDDKPEWMK